MNATRAPEYEIDVAISYASEDEAAALAIKRLLEDSGVVTFFAPARPARRLGQELEAVFDEAYAGKTRFVLALISEHYARKEWTRYELDVALAEEARRGDVVLIPAILGDAEVPGLPANKTALELRGRDLGQAVRELVERVLIERGEAAPLEEFENAYLEWKRTGFLPGPERGAMFLANLETLDLDVDRCEFLLKCPHGHDVMHRDVLGAVEPECLVAAGEKLLEQAESPNHGLGAIAYIGFADPRAAEPHLRAIYEDGEQTVEDRERAFAELWKCSRPGLAAECASVVVDLEVPWQLRRGAAKNLLWSPPAEESSRSLGRAIHDPRREVRSVVCDAIVKFRLEDLAGELIEEYENQRSRKGKNDLTSTLRHFNHRPEVVEFGRAVGLPPSFFQPPPYVHDWDAHREGWL